MTPPLSVTMCLVLCILNPSNNWPHSYYYSTHLLISCKWGTMRWKWKYLLNTQLENSLYTTERKGWGKNNSFEASTAWILRHIEKCIFLKIIPLRSNKSAVGYQWKNKNKKIEIGAGEACLKCPRRGMTKKI